MAACLHFPPFHSQLGGTLVGRSGSPSVHSEVRQGEVGSLTSSGPPGIQVPDVVGTLMIRGGETGCDKLTLSVQLKREGHTHLLTAF